MRTSIQNWFQNFGASPKNIWGGGEIFSQPLRVRGLHSTPLHLQGVPLSTAPRPLRWAHCATLRGERWVCLYVCVMCRERGGERGLCIEFSIAPNFSSGSVSLLTSRRLRPAGRPAHHCPLTPIGPIGRPWASRRQPGHLASHTACRISIPLAAQTAAKQLSLNLAAATHHSLKRTQVSPLCACPGI